jgi:plastocyanin
MHPRRLAALAALLLLPPALAGVGALSSVAITSPADGAQVAGVVTVQGTAESGEGITHVHLQVDGGAFEPADTLTGGNPRAWTKAVDTTGLLNGPHTLTARARTGGGEFVFATITVFVSSGADTDLRAVSLEGGTGVIVPLRLTAANDGGTGLVGVVALFEYRYKDTWRTIGTTSGDIPAYSTAVLDVDWVAPGLVGRFDVRGTLDPEDAVGETDEGNNVALGEVAFVTSDIEGIDVLDPPVADPTPPRTHTIAMLGTTVAEVALGRQFDLQGPHVLVVREGDSAVWQNLAPDGLAHTATQLLQDAHQFDTGPVAPGATSEPVVFDEPGEWNYYCDFHRAVLPGSIRPYAYVIVLERVA